MSGSLNNAKRNNGDLAGADLMIYFTHDDQAEFAGIAPLGSACGRWSSSKANLNIWQSTAVALAGTVAHEIGHNLGMNHDHIGSNANNLRVHNGQKCHGLMAYGQHPNVWSPCSVADFKAHYTNKMDSWCMPGIDSFEFFRIFGLIIFFTF